jgi:hypothetical protein
VVCRVAMPCWHWSTPSVVVVGWVPKVQSYEAAGWVFVAFATLEGMVGDEPASATYPLDRRTAGTINVAGAGAFLYREPVGRGVPVFVTNTAGDQVLDLVPEWDYVDGRHLLAPADDFPRGGLLWRTRLRSKPAHSPVAAWYQAEGTRLAMAGPMCLTRWEWSSVQLFDLRLPGPNNQSIPLEYPRDSGFGVRCGFYATMHGDFKHIGTTPFGFVTQSAGPLFLLSCMTCRVATALLMLCVRLSIPWQPRRCAHRSAPRPS